MVALATPEVVVDVAGEPLVDEHGQPRVIDEDGDPVVHLDPVAATLPAAAVPGESHNPRVSGHSEASTPVSLDVIDLTWPARSATVSDPYGDQVGRLSVAAVLDEWVSCWRQYRDVGEGRPEPTVEVLTRWLAERVDDACDDGRGIGEFHGEVGHLVAVLRAVNGLSEYDEYLAGVACPRCNHQTLWRTNGSEWIECASCPHLMSADEYRRHTQWLASVRHRSERPSERKAS